MGMNLGLGSGGQKEPDLTLNKDLKNPKSELLTWAINQYREAGGAMADDATSGDDNGLSEDDENNLKERIRTRAQRMGLSSRDAEDVIATVFGND